MLSRRPSVSLGWIFSNYFRKIYILQNTEERMPGYYGIHDVPEGSQEYEKFLADSGGYYELYKSYGFTDEQIPALLRAMSRLAYSHGKWIKPPIADPLPEKEPAFVLTAQDRENVFPIDKKKKDALRKCPGSIDDALAAAAR